MVKYDVKGCIFWLFLFVGIHTTKPVFHEFKWQCKIKKFLNRKSKEAEPPVTLVTTSRPSDCHRNGLKYVYIIILMLFFVATTETT